MTSFRLSSLTAGLPLLRRQLFTLGFGALLVVGAPGVGAQTTPSKIAPDLERVLPLTASPGVTWASYNTTTSTLYVKVILVSGGADTAMNGIRQAVLSNGGSVHYVFASVRAMLVMLPAKSVAAIAARSDVQVVVPNRPASRSGGLLQDSVGASLLPTMQVQTSSGNGQFKTVANDGAGVGIAILDSGVDFRHRNFVGPNGNTRVKLAADMVAVLGRYGMNGWAVGQDYTGQVTNFIQQTGSGIGGSANSYWAPSATTPDLYGHGTFVASVAAGIGSYQQPDSTGVAPVDDL